jgi:hypothetical protein
MRYDRMLFRCRSPAPAWPSSASSPSPASPSPTTSPSPAWAPRRVDIVGDTPIAAATLLADGVVDNDSDGDDDERGVVRARPVAAVLLPSDHFGLIATVSAAWSRT